MLIDDLLTEIKGRLTITWNDEGTERDLKIQLNRGQAYLNKLCGTKFSFNEDSPERELLMERCRYIWNNALDDFEKNFSKELSRLILTTAVEGYGSEVVEDGTGTDTGNI
jgi:hypothetical protein